MMFHGLVLVWLVKALGKTGAFSYKYIQTSINEH